MLETGLRDKLALNQASLALTHVKPVSFGEGIERKKRVYISAKTALCYSPRFPLPLSSNLILSAFLPSIFILQGCCGSLFLVIPNTRLLRFPLSSVFISLHRAVAT